MIVIALALASALSGIRNGFAYDDVLIIVRDERLHDIGNAWRAFIQSYWPQEFGGALYRPLTSFAFALQWAAGGGSPLPFHVVSIILYAAVSVAVFRLASQLFNGSAALLSAAIFAVHPVHVEAVANIVGQSELASALLVVIAVTCYMRWARALGVFRITMLCGMYAGALMFKEHAVTLPALLIAADFHVVRGETLKQRLHRLKVAAIGAVAVAVAFVAVRAWVLGHVTAAGDSAEAFAGLSFGQRVLTALSIVPEWMRLFLWPASLSADYSPPRINPVTQFDLSLLAPIGIFVGLCVIAVYARKYSQGVTYAFCWIGIAMVIPSNIIIVIGLALAERTLFLPSVGVAMVLGFGVMQLACITSESARRLVLASATLLLAAGVARSSLRNPVWTDNETLFRQMVIDAPDSWRAHTTLGELLVSQGKGEGIAEMTLGASLSPANNLKVRWVTASRFHRVKQYEAALPFYRQSIALDPANPEIREAAASCMMAAGRVAEAREVALEGLRRSPGNPRLTRLLAMADKAATGGHYLPL